MLYTWYALLCSVVIALSGGGEDKASVFIDSDCISRPEEVASKSGGVQLEVNAASPVGAVAPTCLNLNGDFALGSLGWTLGTSSNWNITDGQLQITNPHSVSQTFTVTEGQIYSVSLYLQSNESEVKLSVDFKPLLGAVLQTQELIRLSPRGGSVYTLTFQVPIGVQQGILNISADKVSITRVDDVCIYSDPTGNPLNVGCTNLRSDFEDGSWAQWFSSQDSEVRVTREKGLKSLEISKEFVKVWTYFPARANRVYDIDLKVLGEDADDKVTFVSIVWENSLGVTLATTNLFDRKFPNQYTVDRRQAVAPNNANISRAKIIFETRTSGKTWINYACISERGRVGASSLVSGLAFDDVNRNGRRASGENLVGDVITRIYKDNGDGVVSPGLDQLIATQITDASSGYKFSNLAAGNYYVLMSLPPTKQVSPKDAHGSSNDDVDSDFLSYTYRMAAAAVTDIFTLTGADSRLYVDLGLASSDKAAISGYLWADTNGDNIRNEPTKNGLNGVVMESTGPFGTIRTVSTFGPDGSPGYYVFNYVEPQTVKIKVVLPAGVGLRGLGGDNSFDPLTAQTASITLLPNETYWNRSAALIVSGTEICDNRVDDDLDGRIDQYDDDCSQCTVPAEILCGEPFKQYMPPVWLMTDSSRTVYVGPAYIRLTTSAERAYVTIRNKDYSYNQNFIVSREAPLQVRLDERLISQTRSFNTVEQRKGVMIESDHPVQAVYFIDGSFNKEIVTLKGHQALGNRFRAGSQVAQYSCPGGLPGLPSITKAEAHFVSVMATEDNTEVTFKFDPTQISLMGGLTSPHSLYLNAGETYLIRDNNTNQTVSGILVTSDKAISVVSGSQHTNVCGVGGLDAGIDQLVPECYVGQDYVAVKHKGHGNQHYAVVVPTVDSTKVFLDGSATPLFTINAGKYCRIPLTGVPGTAHHIRTSSPAYVYHFSGISTNNEVGMALAAAVGPCRGDRYLRFLKGETGDQDLSVILPTAALASLKLNNVTATTLSGVIVNPVISQPTYTALTIGAAHLWPVNTLIADQTFQVALLIGISNSAGCFGYLTSFSSSIVTKDPVNDAPVSQYELPSLCAGSVMNHTVPATSCGSTVRIVSSSNNTSLGTIELTGPLSIKYTSSSTGGGKDNISLRLRDDNGVESSVCIEQVVCGANVTMDGIPNNLTLSCSDPIPVGSPIIYSTDCPFTGTINYTDASTAGSCPQSTIVQRTWSATTECGLVISRTRTFTIVDVSAPSFANVPAAITLCGGAALPSVNPTVTDNCSAAAAVNVVSSQSRTDFPGTAYHEIERRWTATDQCGNVGTASQLVRFTEVPVLGSITVTNPTCGNNNGSLRVDWAAESRRSNLQLSINGVWQTPISTASSFYTFNSLAPGSYTISARWDAAACPINFGSRILSNQTATLGATQIYNIGAGTGTDIINGTTYDRRNFSANWNLLAPISGTNPSVKFTISGTASGTATFSPPNTRYPGAISSLSWSTGTYTVLTQVYSGPGGTGAICNSRTVTFSLIDAENCSNGIDDDGDGFIDCDDAACPKPAAVTRVTN